MKLSELRPCALCGGKVYPIFYRVRVEQVMVDVGKVNQVLGLNHVLGGKALGVAEAMSPVDEVTFEVGSKEAILCQECAFGRDVLATIWDSEEVNGAGDDV